MNLFWKSFIEQLARNSSRGSVRGADGISAAWVNSSLALTNGTFLTSEVSDEAELRGRFQSVVHDAEPHGLPWALFTYEPFLKAIEPERVRELAGEVGLSFMLRLRVMTADVNSLASPVRPLPEIEFRQIETREDKWQALELNMRAYGMPVEMAESVLETGAFFKDPEREFGFLGLADGQVVSTASVAELGGWLYVFLVATDPAHQRKGYAEAVMRQALAVSSSELAITRTSLDGTDAGAPLYHQMGYRYTGEEWGTYLFG